MSDGLTLREIARLAKVSTATVSRAINRVPTVNPVLARRIRKVIEKEGYFPNTNARALVRNSSRQIKLNVQNVKRPAPFAKRPFIVTSSDKARLNGVDFGGYFLLYLNR